ncbi:MAG: hypothetical protein ACTHN5_14055 [Phycisphaerae bacterium]
MKEEVVFFSKAARLFGGNPRIFSKAAKIFLKTCDFSARPPSFPERGGWRAGLSLVKVDEDESMAIGIIPPPCTVT